MPFKITYFFNSILGRSAGWTETYWTTASSIKTALGQAMSGAPYRAACLSEDSAMVYVRVSDPMNPRLVLINDFEAVPVQSGQWAGAPPWNCFLMRLVTTTGPRRAIFFRDIPATLANDENNINNAEPAFAAACNAFKNWMLTFGTPWALQTNTPPGPRGLIQVLAPNAQQFVVVTTTAPHGLSASLPVKLTKISTFPQLNKTWRITVIDATNFGLNDSFWPEPGAPNVVGEGKFAQKNYNYPLISDLIYERVTHRIVGRPFGLQRGARRRAK